MSIPTDSRNGSFACAGGREKAPAPSAPESLVCTICTAPARFLTAGGTMCPTCALFSAIWQGPTQRWLPVLIQPDGAPSESDRFSDSPRVPA